MKISKKQETINGINTMVVVLSCTLVERGIVPHEKTKPDPIYKLKIKKKGVTKMGPQQAK